MRALRGHGFRSRIFGDGLVLGMTKSKLAWRLLVIGVLWGGRVQADDWPQWLGPQRDAVWRESGILEQFPADGLKVLWRTPIGAGYSGPSVASGRVYVTDRLRPSDAEPTGDPFAREQTRGVERVHCLDAADGKRLWTHEYECAYTVSYPAGPRVAPLVSGGRVYTLGAEGHLFCLNAEDGRVIWSREFKAEFGVKAPMWGFAGHPLLDGQRLICLAAGAGTTVVAFDKDSGKELWRALAAAEPGYSSPVIYEAGGTRQLIIFHPESANSLDPETGKLHWSVPFKSNAGLSVAMPRKWGDYLFFTSFYNGALMLKLPADRPGADVVWQTQRASERDTTHLNAIIPTPFLEDGHIYGICSYGQLRCLKIATGERVWETFQATTGGAPVRWANAFIVKQGSRFFLANERGELIIARLSPAGFEEISRTRLLEPTNGDPGRKVVWSHPAYANQRVYARNDREILCADLAARP